MTIILLWRSTASIIFSELARQMEFAPRETRLHQIAAAEQLLHSVNPDRAYPLELVIHKVTGYRPRSYSEDRFAGQALQHDLGLLIEQVSETLDIQAKPVDRPCTDDRRRHVKVQRHQ